MMKSELRKLGSSPRTTGVDVSHLTGPLKRATTDYTEALAKYGPDGRQTREAKRALDRATAAAGAELERLTALEAIKAAPQAANLTPGAMFNGLQKRAGFGA
ncbi:MAG TPA: hypothetical protein VGM06_05525 [Polyangiaceae bacterium]|jgi:hypothetical protein